MTDEDEEEPLKKRPKPMAKGKAPKGWNKENGPNPKSKNKTPQGWNKENESPRYSGKSTSKNKGPRNRNKENESPPLLTQGRNSFGHENTDPKLVILKAQQELMAMVNTMNSNLTKLIENVFDPSN